MRKVFIVSIVVFCFCGVLVGQQLQFSPEYLKKHVYALASDSLKGRATGTEEQKKAANYIASEFKKYGLQTLSNNSYFHYYNLVRQHKNAVLVKSNSTMLFSPWHYHFVSGYNHNDTLESELVFCGLGSDAEVGALETSQKAIAFIANSPQQAYQRIVELKTKFGNRTYFVLFPEKNKDLEKVWELSYMCSEFNLENEFQKTFNLRITEDWAIPNDSLNIFYCFTDVMRNVFQFDDKQLQQYSKQQLSLNIAWLKTLDTPSVTCFMNYNDSIERVQVENVGGVVYGKNKEQVVVVSAHYDHIGAEMSDIFYGADDNASGTSALLELARLFGQQALNEKLLERSILFLAFSGEEMGLFGSKAYVEQPEFSMDSTIVNINMDMIGRSDEKHAQDSNFVYILNGGKGSKRYFKLANKKINVPNGFEVSNNPGAYEKLVYRFGSDHFNFAEKQVPISVIFTGLHDDYHTPNDTPDKINYHNLGNITQLLYQYIYIITDNPKEYPLRFKR